MPASGFQSDAIGGVLASEVVLESIIKPLDAASVVMRSGARMIIAPAAESVHIPKLSAVTISDPWRAENSEIAEAEADWDEVELLPSSLKSVKTIHRLSNELARKAPPRLLANDPNAADSAYTSGITSALVHRLAAIVDAAMLTGDGADNTITGLLNVSGAADLPAPGGVLDLDAAHDAMTTVQVANAVPSHWFAHPQTFALLRKQRANGSDGPYMLEPDPAAPYGYTLLGLPVLVTTAMPGPNSPGGGSLLLIDRDQIVIGVDSSLEVRILGERYAEFDQVGVRVVGRFDIVALNGEGLAVVSGIGAGGSGSGSGL